MSNQVLIESHFEKHWLSWVALNHLLTAPLLRTLFAIVVQKASKGELAFSDLFEDQSLSQTPGLESWVYKSKEVTGELPQYLQRLVQNLIWQNDSESYPPDWNSESPELGGPFDLEAAVQFGVRDFSVDESAAPSVRVADSSLFAIAAIMREVRPFALEAEAQFFANKVMSAAKQLEWPLSTAVMKHFGDLCADADRWDKALLLYTAAEQQIPEDPGPWSLYVRSLRDILFQSHASAKVFIEGPAQSAEMLGTAVAESDLESRPLLSVNAPFDALIVSIMAGSIGFRQVRRGTLALPPLCTATHDLSTAHSYLNQRKFSDALRKCWAVLRRQFALGSAADTRATKFEFGRAILLQLENDEQRRATAADFKSAVRLLLESGDSSALKMFDWPKETLKRYLDAAVVDEFVPIISRYPKAAIERRMAAIEIFRSWTIAIGEDQREVARRMLRFISEAAGYGQTAFFSNVSVGGRALEVLEELAEKRPEFNKLIVDDVVAAIVQRVSQRADWIAAQKALALAITFINDFSQDQARQILDQTLVLLDGVDPAKQAWPITRPALEILASKRASELARSFPQLGQRILDTVLKFGNEQPTESAALLFRLNSFDPDLLKDPKIMAAVQPAVNEVRRGLENINSSGAIGNIQALLLSPAISGLEAVELALQALLKVISSAQTGGVNIGFTYAYAPLLMIADKKVAFSTELKVDQSVLDAWWSKLYAAVLDVWAAAAVRPLVFAGFALPRPTRPNPVAVHNWAFASLRFSEGLGRRREMASALLAAMKTPELRTPISVALATGTGSDEFVDTDPENILRESQQVFYAALGRRLAVLVKLPTETALRTCDAMLRQCFRYGPKEIDAAVLALALQMEVSAVASGDLARTYRQRVSASPEYRSALTPLLVRLGITED